MREIYVYELSTLLVLLHVHMSFFRLLYESREQRKEGGGRTAHFSLAPWLCSCYWTLSRRRLWNKNNFQLDFQLGALGRPRRARQQQKQLQLMQVIKFSKKMSKQTAKKRKEVENEIRKEREINSILQITEIVSFPRQTMNLMQFVPSGKWKTQNRYAL